MSNSSPSSERIKEKAKQLRQFILEKTQVDVSHGQCLDFTSQQFGYKDWNSANSVTKLKRESLKLPMQIETVGELRELLNLFEDDFVIDANYQLPVAELLESLREEPSPGDRIHQEFSMSFEGFNEDIVSFELKLKHSAMFVPTKDDQGRDTFYFYDMDLDIEEEIEKLKP